MNGMINEKNCRVSKQRPVKNTMKWIPVNHWASPGTALLPQLGERVLIYYNGGCWKEDCLNFQTIELHRDEVTLGWSLCNVTYQGKHPKDINPIVITHFCRVEFPKS